MIDDEDSEYDLFGKVAVADSLELYKRAVIPFLSRRFSAQSVLAIAFKQSARPEILFRWIPDARLRSTFDEVYGQLGFMLDPFFRRCWQIRDWEACLLRDIAPDRFESSEYFSAYFQATNMVDDMGFVARLSEDVAVHLSIGRNSGQRRYRAGDIAKFRQLARVLAPKLRLIMGPILQDTSIASLSLSERFYNLADIRGTSVSPREAEVAALIVQGHSSRAIALNLSISFHTVKVHRRALYKKLNISSQSELFGLLSGQNGFSHEQTS